MKFALIGDHPDGLDMAHAMAQSGRHKLSVYCGPVTGERYLQRWGLSCPRTGDFEEILADPSIQTIIVADKSNVRFQQTKRALQAEKQVLCVHPVDAGPDAAHEADLIGKENRCVLLPLLTQPLHPALERLAMLIKHERRRNDRANEPSDAPKLLQIEVHSTESLVHNLDVVEQEPGFPVWDVLRALGGEIVELSAYGQFFDVNPDDAICLTGSFDRGGVFQVTLLPYQSESHLRLSVFLRSDRAELIFHEGYPGPCTIHWRDDAGNPREEAWENWNPWARLVEVFDEIVAQPLAAYAPASPGSTDITADRRLRQSVAVSENEMDAGVSQNGQMSLVSWQDEIRCLELDQAARRSIAQRRCSTLEYQEAVEEASFKGTMTLVGCGMLWLGLILLIASVWVNHLFWVMLPLLAIFLVLQILRWVIPAAGSAKSATAKTNGAEEKPS